MIEIVTSPSCKYCVLAKNWLRSEGVQFVELDAKKVGGQRIPRLRIDGEDVLTGWNESAWRAKIRARAPTAPAPAPEREIRRYRGAGSIQPSAGIVQALSTFFATPAPPTEAHRAGVTALGALGGYGLSRVGKTSTVTNAAIGVGTILAGHAAGSWEAKSVGYGILLEALGASVKHRIQAHRQNPGSRMVIVDEATYLRGLRSDEAGRILGAIGGTWSPFEQPTHIAIGDVVMERGDYGRRYAEKVGAAVTAGRTEAVQEIAGRQTDRDVAAEAWVLGRAKSDAFNTAMGVSFTATATPTHVDLRHGGTMTWDKYMSSHAAELRQAAESGHREAQVIINQRARDAQPAPPPPPPPPSSEQNPILIAARERQQANTKNNAAVMTATKTNAVYVPRADANSAQQQEYSILPSQGVPPARRGIFRRG